MKLWWKVRPEMPDSHPDEDMLLLALERELPAAEIARVDRHLGACWTCRARSEELERGILAFVEYREKRYLPSLPPPPNEYRPFAGRLRKLEAEGGRVAVHRRISRFMEAAFPERRRTIWIAGALAALAAVVFWNLRVLSDPQLVSASELLSRAEDSQKQAAPSEHGGRLVAHQTLRVRNRFRTVVRDLEWPVGSPLQPIAWRGSSDPAQWDTPLSAEGFARWRASLSSPADEVRRSRGLLTLRTIAHGEISEARLVVRAGDFHPVEEALQFAAGPELEITEVSFEIRSEAPAMAVRVEPPPVSKSEPSQVDLALSEPLPPPPSEGDLSNAELALRYQLFQRGWDIGDDLAISRAGGRVRISGVASSDDQAEEIREVLSGQRLIDPEIQSPSEVLAAHSAQPDLPETSADTAADPPEPAMAPMLEKAIPSDEDRRSLINHALAASDSALEQAWALRKLAERYTDGETRLLTAPERGKLLEIIRGHVAQLARSEAELRPLIDLMPPPAQVDAITYPSWRSALLSVFEQAEIQDRFITQLLGGTGGSLTLTEGIAGLNSAHARLQSAVSAIAGQIPSAEFFTGEIKND